MDGDPGLVSLSEMLNRAVPEGERERRSKDIDEPANAISRWISRDVVPGPGKYDKIADLLGITPERVGAAAAIDAYHRWKARLIQ
jgi:hypothetical protein